MKVLAQAHQAEMLAENSPDKKYSYATSYTHFNRILVMSNSTVYSVPDSRKQKVATLPQRLYKTSEFNRKRCWHYIKGGWKRSQRILENKAYPVLWHKNVQKKVPYPSTKYMKDDQTQWLRRIRSVKRRLRTPLAHSDTHAFLYVELCV